MAYKDVTVTVGTYEKDGQTKKQYQRVGRLIETDKGTFIVLEPWFNPAGCINPKDGKVWMSCYEPRPKPTEGQKRSADRPHRMPSADRR